MISLGCARNLVDSEVLLGHVVEEGLQVVQGRRGRRRRRRQHLRLHRDCQAGVDRHDPVGRPPQSRRQSEGRHRRRLPRAALRRRTAQVDPELDAVFGLSDYSGVPAVVRKIVNGSARAAGSPPSMAASPRARAATASVCLLTPKSFAYLRISEGCDHKCTFCAIPQMRGRNRSKPIDVLIEEAQNLAAAGVQELVVVAEDSTAYGLDLNRKRQIHTLLERLGDVEGIRWIRLMYAYPHTVAPELTTFLREHPKAVKYLDIPIQHISSPMLKAMKRGVSSEQVRGILDRLRDEVPGIAVRSTLITGFPGETEQDFAELRSLVASYRFERLGVFPYSREETTPAHDMPEQVPEAVAQERAGELMAMQRDVMLAFQKSFVGKTVPVLVDGYDAEAKSLVGRTYADAPEVDCRVLLPKGAAEPGVMVSVRITEASEYELHGKLADDTKASKAPGQSPSQPQDKPKSKAAASPAKVAKKKA
jgi:ribosomal protein S12 methylthiotransferase